MYFGARVGAASDPPFLVEKLPRGGVLVALSSRAGGRLQPAPTARLIPAGRLFRADGVISVPVLVESSRTRLALPIIPTTTAGTALYHTLRYSEFSEAGDVPILDLNPANRGRAARLVRELPRQSANREHWYRFEVHPAIRSPPASGLGGGGRSE